MFKEEKLAIKAIDELYANNGEDLKKLSKIEKIEKYKKTLQVVEKAIEHPDKDKTNE